MGRQMGSRSRAPKMDQSAKVADVVRGERVRIMSRSLDILIFTVSPFEINVDC